MRSTSGLQEAANAYCIAWYAEFVPRFFQKLPRELRDMVYGFMSLPRYYGVTEENQDFTSTPAFEPDLKRYLEMAHNVQSHASQHILRKIPFYLHSQYLGPAFVSEMAEIFFREVPIYVNLVNHRADLPKFLSQTLPLTKIRPKDHMRELFIGISLPGWENGYRNMPDPLRQSAHLLPAHMTGAFLHRFAQDTMNQRGEYFFQESDYIDSVKPIESLSIISNADRLRLQINVAVNLPETLGKFEMVLKPIVEGMQKRGIHVSVLPSGNCRDQGILSELQSDRPPPFGCKK